MGLVGMKLNNSFDFFVFLQDVEYLSYLVSVGKCCLSGHLTKSHEIISESNFIDVKITLNDQMSNHNINQVLF